MEVTGSHRLMSHQVSAYFKAHYFESIHAIKAAIAFMIAYIIYSFIPHADIRPQWIFITIVVIMASHSALGAQVQKSIFRVWATLFGASLALFVINLPYWHYYLPVFLFVSSILFIFVAVSYEKYTYTASLGLITFCMITLSNTPTSLLALARTTEILLGIAIALLVTIFIIPIHSIKLIRQRAIVNTGRLQKLYQLVLIENKLRFKNPESNQVEKKILTSLNTQRQLQAHLKYEKKAHKRKADNIHQVIRYQQAIYRYFSVLEISKRLLCEPPNNHKPIIQLFTQFIKQLIVFLSEVTTYFPDIPKNEIQAMRITQHEMFEYTQQQPKSSEAVSVLHTICFTAERIICSCERLSEQLHKIS